MELHLDRIYRNRYQKFYLSNGKEFDSREYNWRQIQWEKVIKIYTNIRNNEYWVNCKSPSFLFFMNYRTTGEVWNINSLKVNSSLEKRKIAEWNIGYTDGMVCFMKAIDFKTGALIKEYQETLSSNSKHIHPRVKHLLNRNSPLIVGG